MTPEVLQRASLELSAAVLRCWDLFKFQGTTMIAETVRTRAEKRGVDPIVADMEFNVAIDLARVSPDSWAYDAARIELVEALRYCWYRFPYLHKRQLMQAVRDLAEIRDEDRSEAVMVAEAVLNAPLEGGNWLSNRPTEAEMEAAARMRREEKARTARRKVLGLA